MLAGLRFGPPVERLDRGQSILVEVARPDGAFWNAWRSEKESIKQAGLRVYKSPVGVYEVWRKPAGKSANPAPASQPHQPEPRFQPVTVLADQIQKRSRSSAKLAPEPIQEAKPDSGRVWSDEQKAIFAWFRDGKGNLVVSARAGTGKCLGKGTPVLMFDGKIKPVENINVGDLLIGPDSKPRKVLSTCVGRSKLVKVIPVKGDPWVCNDAHILTLMGTNVEMGRVIDVPVTQIGLINSKNWKLWRVPVEWPSQSLSVDPYLLGLWIGDGTLGEAQITNSDLEVRRYCVASAAKYGLQCVLRWTERNHTFNIRFRVGTRGNAGNNTPHFLRRFFKACSKSGHKEIPHQYLQSSKSQRAELLAGILDTDGFYDRSGVFEIITHVPSLAESYLFLARSLGFAAYASSKTGTIKSIGFTGHYTKVMISGDFSKLPMKVHNGRVRQQIKRVGVTGFKLQKAGVGQYFGFTLDGDGRFLLGDFTVTHNTTTIKEAFSHAREEDILYCVFNKRNQIEAQGKIQDPRVQIRTLHSLGYRFIRDIWRDAKPDDAVEYDRIKALDTNLPEVVANAIEKLVGFGKNTLIVPTVAELERLCDDYDVYAAGFEVPEAGGWDSRKIAQYALRAMEASKIKDPQARVSFNDMVWLPVAMGWVRPLFDLVVVDEAQDQNLPQLVMSQRACRKAGRVVVVGDSRQAIYGFRGAKQGAMEYMRAELKATLLPLNTTYRCPKVVVAEAARLVPDYRAAPSAPEGLLQSCSDQFMMENAKPGDAILSRVNAPLMSTCLLLLKRGTPARIEGRDIGKQLANMVRSLNARSVPDFLARVERWRVKAIHRASKAKRNNQAKIDAANDQAMTLVAVAEGLASVAEIEKRVLDLFQDSSQNPRPAVTLSSVHKAKGGEWDRVFLLDSTFKVKTGTAISEDANIRYVALTRSKNQLFLVGGTSIASTSITSGLSKALNDIGEKHGILSGAI